MEPEFHWHWSERKAVGSFCPLWLLVYACLLFFLNSCAKELPSFEAADLPVSLVVKKLEKRRNHLSSFTAVGTLGVQGGKRRWSGKVFLLSEVPNSLRLEVVSFLGQPILYLASDGDHFMLWEPGRRRAYRGLASDSAIANLIDIPLKDREALLLLAGSVPPWNYDEAKLFRLQGSKTLMLQLEDIAAELTQRVWLEGEELIVTRLERLQGKKHALEAKFTDFVAVKGSFYPRSIVVEGAKVRLSLRYEEFAPNEPLDASSFRLNLPAGIEIQPWNP